MSKIQLFNILTLLAGIITIVMAIIATILNKYHIIATAFLIVTLIFNYICHLNEKKEIMMKQKEIEEIK